MEGQDGKSQVQAQRLSLASETDTWLFSQILKIPAVCSCANEMQVTDVHVDIGQTATGARFSFQYSVWTEVLPFSCSNVCFFG